MLKTKKLINRKISRLIKAGLVAMNDHDDEIADIIMSHY